MAAFKSTHWSTTFSVWDNNTLTTTEVFMWLPTFDDSNFLQPCAHFAFTPAADSD